MNTLRDFAKQMQAYQRASGVPLREAERQLQVAAYLLGRPRSSSTPQEWERRCAESQERAEARRELGPHPWPERGHVIATVLVALVFIALGWLLLVGGWAVFG